MNRFMFVSLAFSVFALAALTPAAHAQDIPKADVAVGYSAIQVVKGYFLFANGGSASAAWNVKNWLGAVGDFGGYDAANAGLIAETYTFGPRFSYRHWYRLTPFAQVLLGGAHASNTNGGFTGATNAFAFGSGGGIDLGIDRRGRFALRPQLEYLGFRANGNTTGTVRISVGIVFNIGKKVRGVYD